MRRAGAVITAESMLLSNAGFMALGPAVSALLGFVFWWIVARSYPPEAVGLGTAAITAMTFAAAAAEFGIGTLLMGQALNTRQDSPQLIAAGVAAATVLAVVVSFAWIALAHLLSLQILGVVGEGVSGFVFVVGAVAITNTMVTDCAFTGYLRSSLRTLRETVCSSLRILLLIGAIALGHEQRDGSALLLVFVLAQLGSVAFVGMMVVRRGAGFWRAPDLAQLMSLLPKVAGHHLLNIVSLGPTIVLPLLVAELLSPTINAAFFIAWMLLQVALSAPAGFATALYSISAAEPERIAQRLRYSLAVCAALGIAAGLVFFVGLEPMLRIFNPVYPALIGPSLKYIGFSVLALSLKYHYIALMRLEDRMWSSTRYVALGGLVEISASAIGGMVAGLPGLVAGWMLGVCVQAVGALPTVLRAAQLLPLRTVASNLMRSDFASKAALPALSRSPGPPG